jgi:hypothetical protein
MQLTSCTVSAGVLLVDIVLGVSMVLHWSRERNQGYARSIDSVADLKATLRAGRFTSVGGYPLFFITADNSVLSFESVRDNFRECIDAWESFPRWGKLNDDWRVVACDVNYEDESLYCDHSGEKIESAYGD